jgi:hypothetical protein
MRRLERREGGCDLVDEVAQQRGPGIDVPELLRSCANLAQGRAVAWQRLMSCVVKPDRPHWFFNASNPFSASARSR